MALKTFGPCPLVACPGCGKPCILLPAAPVCVGCKHKAEGTLVEAAAFAAKMEGKK